MAYYRFQLKAGVALRALVAGRVILVDDLGGASGLDITPNYGGRDLPTMPGRQKAFKFMEPFDAVTFTAPVDCNVGIFLSASDVSLGFTSGSSVSISSGQVTIANDAAHRVPVDIAGGNINVNAINVGINNTDANPVPVKTAALSTLVTKNAVAVGTGAGQIVLNDPSLKRAVFRNASPTQVVALGGADVTLANAAIVLSPGEAWLETEAAAATWYATADAAGADVRVLGGKA